MTLRIAMIGSKGIPAQSGGVERHVEELSTRLVLRGHQVTVYSRYWYTHFAAVSYRGVRIVNCPSIRTKHLDAITHTFVALLAAMKERYDVIHLHGVGPALLAWIPRLLKPRCKVVVTFHCIDRMHTKWNWLAKRMLRLGEWCSMYLPHHTIVVSKSLQQYCEQTYHQAVVYIPNGFTISMAESNDGLLFRSWGLRDKQYCLIVSRLTPHKGVQHAIAAFSKLQTGFKLVIVGEPAFGQGGYLQTLQQLARSDARIVFLGAQPPSVLSTLYRHAYLTLQPSEAEGLSLAMLDSMAYGTAVLASDIASSQEMIDHSNFLFKIRDVYDLAEKLQYLLSHPEVVVTENIHQQKNVLKQYAWDGIISRIEAVYEDVVKTE